MFVFDDKASEKNRRLIYDLLYPKVFPEENFLSLDPRQLKIMFMLYDEHVFDGQLKTKISEEHSKVNFTITTDPNIRSRKTTFAGCCTCIPIAVGEDGALIASYDFEFPADFYYSLFTDPSVKVLNVNGLKRRNRLECLQVVFEHELIHLIMMLWDYDEKISEGPLKIHYTSHGTIFRKAVYSYFGHTSVKHRMLCGDASGDSKERGSITIGSRVTFKDAMGRVYIGIVSKRSSEKIKVLTDDGGVLIVKVSIASLV
jgi:hypothetical protein